MKSKTEKLTSASYMDGSDSSCSLSNRLGIPCRSRPGIDASALNGSSPASASVLLS